MAYTGSVDLISGIRPKNNGKFPLVNAPDVYVDDNTRLDALLASMLSRIEALEQGGGGGGGGGSSTFGEAVFGTATFA